MPISGSTRKVKSGSTRDFPLYTYVAPRSLHKFHPIVSVSSSLWVNNVKKPDNDYPNACHLNSFPEVIESSQIFIDTLIINYDITLNNVDLHHSPVRFTIIWDPNAYLGNGTTPYDLDSSDFFPTVDDGLCLPAYRDDFQILYLDQMFLNKSSMYDRLGSPYIHLRAGVNSGKTGRLVIPVKKICKLFPGSPGGPNPTPIQGNLLLFVHGSPTPSSDNHIFSFAYRFDYTEVS